MYAISGSRIIKMIDISLRFRFIVLAAAITLLIFAIGSIGQTPTNLLPEFSGTTVEIQTEALGLSAPEVEQLITVPLEADLLNGVAWVQSIRSESLPSVSSIELRFEPGTDMMAARQMVQEKLTQAGGLPNVSKRPVMLQPVSSVNRVLQVGLRSDSLSLIQMSVLARWNIRPRLMGVPGVANVSVWGLRDRQLQVLVDPEQLKSQGIALHNIVATAGNALWVSPLSFLEASSPGTGGFIDGPNQRLGVRHVLPIVSPEALANVIVEGSNKRLGDLTRVVEDHQPLIGDAIVSEKAGLMLVIEKFPWADTLHVTQKVEKVLADMRPGLGSIEMDTRVFRPASYIERAIANLTMVVTVAGLLMLVGIFLFYLDLRITLIAAASMTTSLLAAWFVLILAGVAVDAMVFLGLLIALAIIVDDGIIDVHEIRRRLAEEHAHGVRVMDVIAEISSRVRGPMGYTTLMALLLVLPLVFFNGTAGAFLGAAAKSYALAIILSLLVAMTLTPALGLLLLAKRPGTVDGSLPSRWSARLANRVVGAKKVAYFMIGFALAGVALTAGLAIQQGGSLPEFKETDMLIHLDAKPGTSLPEMRRIASQISLELKTIPGIRSVGGHIGRATTSDQIVGANAGDLWISIDPKADYRTTLGAIEDVMMGYPGVDYDASTHAEQRIEKIRDLDDEKVVVRIYGQDTDVLMTEAHKIRHMVSDMDALREVEVVGMPMEPTIEIQVDLARAQHYGIKPGDVRRAAATLLSGLEVGSLFEEKKVFEVVVWGIPEIRDSVSDVRNLLLQSPTGVYLRLADVANVRVKPQPRVIKRESVARYVDVEIDVGGARAATREIRQRLKGHPFPPEYHAEIVGAESLFGTRASVIGAVFGALIGIFLLLQAAFRSWRLAAMVLLATPVAMMGGLTVIFVSGSDFNPWAVGGLIVTTGLALRVATLLIVHYQKLEHIDGLSFGYDLVARGTAERAAPIVASILGSTLLYLPFFLFREQAGLELAGPVAAVVLASVLTTLVFVLMVLPAMYLALGADAVTEEDFEDLQQDHALHA